MNWKILGSDKVCNGCTFGYLNKGDIFVTKSRRGYSSPFMKVSFDWTYCNAVCLDSGAICHIDQITEVYKYCGDIELSASKFNPPLDSKLLAKG